ncbi:hypothetical protein GCM10010271_29280 [Streptomyces kurssanovii]|nr:hypothetical protein GCM10010271_29280 [Streptomyces kurssanovii]
MHGHYTEKDGQHQHHVGAGPGGADLAAGVLTHARILTSHAPPRVEHGSAEHRTTGPRSTTPPSTAQHRRRRSAPKRPAVTPAASDAGSGTPEIRPVVSGQKPRTFWGHTPPRFGVPGSLTEPQRQ